MKKAVDVYVGATQETLIRTLEAALTQVRESGIHVSVTIYASGTDSQITFTDEDTAGDPPGKLVIEVEPH